MLSLLYSNMKASKPNPYFKFFSVFKLNCIAYQNKKSLTHMHQCMSGIKKSPLISQRAYRVLLSYRYLYGFVDL